MVVDANIARSAGNKDTDPSKNCREILSAIEINRSLYVRLCPFLGSEWAKHASGYSRTWLTSMGRRGRLDRRPVYSLKDLEKCIEQYNDDGGKEPMRKDAHLIEAALCTGKKIISYDGRARYHFSKLAATMSALEKVYWVHISDNASGNAAIVWINDSIPEVDHFLLVVS